MTTPSIQPTALPGFSFDVPRTLVCERQSATRLGEFARRLDMRHVFLVTDPGVLKAGLTDAAQRSLEAAGIRCTVHAEVQADPPEAVVAAAVQAATQAGVDGVVGLGGGSSLDTAKLVALLARSPQPLAAIYGVGLASGARLPLIQMPTTAGTGSEATPIAILTTPSQEKKGVVSPLLLPDLIVLDATLTLGLPAAITAMTGVDAMVHAIEAYTSKIKKNPLSDLMAVRALQLMFAHIDQAVSAGDDLPAREAMLLAATLAGMAFANAPVGAVHALAYPLGGLFHVPHGLSNSLVLGPVLRFNLPVATRHYAELARAVLPAPKGIPCGPPTSPDDAVAADAFVSAMESLVARMPYAQTLRDVGVTEPDLPRLAGDAMNVQRLLVNNPREVSHDDALAIYRCAY